MRNTNELMAVLDNETATISSTELAYLLAIAEEAQDLDLESVREAKEAGLYPRHEGLDGIVFIQKERRK